MGNLLLPDTATTYKLQIHLQVYPRFAFNPVCSFELFFPNTTKIFEKADNKGTFWKFTVNFRGKKLI